MNLPVVYSFVPCLVNGWIEWMLVVTVSWFGAEHPSKRHGWWHVKRIGKNPVVIQPLLFARNISMDLTGHAFELGDCRIAIEGRSNSRDTNCGHHHLFIHGAGLVWTQFRNHDQQSSLVYSFIPLFLHSFMDGLIDWLIDGLIDGWIDRAEFSVTVSNFEIGFIHQAISRRNGSEVFSLLVMVPPSGQILLTSQTN